MTPREVLGELSRSRLPGSDGVRHVEAAMETRLRALGFDLHYQDFVTSSRRLFAVSIGAAGYGWCALLAAPLLLLDVPGWSAALVLLTSMTLVGLLAHGLAEGRLPFDLPEVSARNILATRSPEPSVWLVAHVDSKAQGVSMAGRIVAGGSAVAGLAGLAVLGVARLAGPVSAWGVAPLMVLAVVGAAALSIRPVVANAPGAVDNASGLLAVLSAAGRLQDRPEVGVLLTGAEEFGMAGARHWVATQRHGAGRYFVNFDGVDDRGRFNLMSHGSAGDAGVTERMAGLLVDSGHPVRRAALPIGVFVDGGVLASAMPGVTVSRGDWATLRVVHTPRDRPERLSGEAAVEAGRVAAEAIRLAFG